jgi:hypothetical protein
MAVVGFDESRGSFSVTTRYLVSRLYCTALLTCVTHIYHHHTLMCLLAAAACRRGVDSDERIARYGTIQVKTSRSRDLCLFFFGFNVVY